MKAFTIDSITSSKPLSPFPSSTTATTKKTGLTSNQRRRYFTKIENRQAAVLHPDLVIAGDFFNNFTNFEARRVNMGISFRMDRVLQGHPLRFVCKSRHQDGKGHGHGHGQGQGRQMQPEAKKFNNMTRNTKHEFRLSTANGRRNASINPGERNKEMDSSFSNTDDSKDEEKEMDDEEDETVFFVAELQWDQPSVIVLG
ncbi:hypothetical protein FBU30_005115 [Linnemannia zychae]|nr:hypothetical protein FBU30_005115 [Linnemannia zychae]